MQFNSAIHTELNKLFQQINKRFYNNELVMPNILVQSVGKKRWLGYCTTKKVWDINGNPNYEIAISSEYLNREFHEVVATLMHELVHLYNLYAEVRDVSGTQYHNKRFRLEAEKRGLSATYASVIGWSVTRLTGESRIWVDTLDVDRKVFDAVRKMPIIEKKKAPKTYTYTCPVCKEKVLSKNPDLEIVCLSCDTLFERRIKGD